MTLLIIAGVLLLASIAIATVPWAWQRIVTRKNVVVNLKSGTTVRGVAYRKRGPLLVLKSPEWNNGTAFTKMDGDAVVRIVDIDFIQVP